MMRSSICVLFACFAVVAISQTCDLKTLTYTDLLADGAFTVDAKALSGIAGILTVSKGTGSASVEYQRGQGYNAAVTKGLVTITRQTTIGASQLGGANVLVTLALAALALVSQRGSLAALALVLAIATVALAACATATTVNVSIVVDQALLKNFVLQVKADPTTSQCPTGVTIEGALGPQVVTSVTAGICSYTFTNTLFGCPNTCGDVANNVDSTTCVAGVCTLTCTSGFQSCNNNCDTPSDAVTSCGTCTNDCSSAVANVDTVTCVAGSCDYDDCAAGFSDCDGDRSNGCEPTSSIESCGSCSNNCTALPGIDLNEPITCDPTSFQCSVSCAAGLLDCDIAAPGCESDATLSTSCGSCSNDCTILTDTNAGASTCNSVAGACEYTCDIGFDDCTAALGCETATQSNLQNCGTCGNDCAGLPNIDPVSSACTAGVCIIECAAGFQDCDGDSTNGCEIDIGTNITDCGSCGNDCSALPNVDPSSVTCTSGLCDSTCAVGFSNCAGTAGIGCPDDTASDPLNCGACRNDCPDVLNAVKTCVASTCDYTACNSGFLDCNGDRTDGCETATNSINACGACDVNCEASGTTGNFQSATCTGSPLACGLNCLTGFTDCDNDFTNGCEVNTAGDVAQCGQCGVACNLPNTATYKCNAGTCETLTCNPNFAFCANPVTGGCTINTQTNPQFCGGCTATPCASLFSVLPAISCAGGICQTATNCVAGFNDCDGDVTTGCETATNVCVPTGTLANGQTCSGARGYTNPLYNVVDCATLVGTNNVATSVCNINAGSSTAGQCTITCVDGFSDCDGNPINGCEANDLFCGSSLTGSTCETALKDPLSPAVNCLALATDPILNQTVTQTVGSNICDQSNGECIYTCSSNYYDCDLSGSNGCEVDTRKCPINSPADCGVSNNTRCGPDCVNCLTLSGTEPGSATCDTTANQCIYTCPDSLCQDVDGLASNGCETAQGYLGLEGVGAVDCSTDIDLTNVEAFGPIFCDANSTSPTRSRCLFTCKDGFIDCDENPRNGCETQIGGDSKCTTCSFMADVSCGQNKCVDCTLLEGTLGSDYANGRWASASASTCLPVNASLANRATDWYCDTSVHRLNPRFDPPDGDNGACQSELCRDLDGDWSNGCESAQQYGRGRFYYYGDSLNTDAYLVPYVPNPYEDRFYEYKAAFTAFPDSDPSSLLFNIVDDIKILDYIHSGGVSGVSIQDLIWQLPSFNLAGRVYAPEGFSQSTLGFSYPSISVSSAETGESNFLFGGGVLSGREIALLHYAADVFTDVDEPSEAAEISLLGEAYLTPVDCVLSEWSDWGLCTYGDDCIKRDYFLMTRIRTRAVITPASGGGVCHLPLVEDFYRFSHRNSDANVAGFTPPQVLPNIAVNMGTDYQHGGGFATRVDYTGSGFGNTVDDILNDVLHWGPNDWSFENLWVKANSLTGYSSNDPKILSWTGNEVEQLAVVVNNAPTTTGVTTSGDRSTSGINAYGFTLTCAPRRTCPDVNIGLPFIHCNISAWTEWSACSATCDGDWAGGVRIRTRTVITPASQNGECFQNEFDAVTGLPLPLYGANAGLLYEEDWQCNDHSCSSYDCNQLKDATFALDNHIYLGADAVSPQCDGRDWPEYVNGMVWMDVNRDGLDDNTVYTVKGDNDRIYPIEGNFPLWNTVFNLSYEYRWPGHCLYECEEGWFDCDHDPRNGCETSGDFCSIDVEFGSNTQLTHPIKPWEHPHGECTIAWKHDASGVVARDCTNFNQLFFELENTVGKCVPATGLCDLACNYGFANCDGDGCVDVTGAEGYCGTACVDCTQLSIFKYGYTGWSCQPSGGDFACGPTSSCANGCSDNDGDYYNGCETAVYEQLPYPDVTPFDTELDQWSAWTVCSRLDDCGYLWDMDTTGGDVFRNVPIQTRYRRPVSSAYNGGSYPDFVYASVTGLSIDGVSFPSLDEVLVKLSQTPSYNDVRGLPLVQNPFYEVRVCPQAVTPCIECTNQLAGLEQHCVLSEWTKWSACSAECVDRIASTSPVHLPWDPTAPGYVTGRTPFQIRTRSVVTPAQLGGRCPPPLDTWQQAEVDSNIEVSSGTLIDDFRANRLLSAKASFLVDVRKCNTEKCQYPEDCDALNYWYPGHFSSISTCGAPGPGVGSFSPSPIAVCIASNGFNGRSSQYDAGCNFANGYCDSGISDLRDGCDTYVYPTHCGRIDSNGYCNYDKFFDCTTLPGVVSPFAAPCVIDPNATALVGTFADPNPASQIGVHVCDIRWACNATACTNEDYGRAFGNVSARWEDGCEVARNYRYPFVTVDSNYPYASGEGNPISIFYDIVQGTYVNQFVANDLAEGTINYRTFHDPLAFYTLNATAIADNSVTFDFDCHGYLYSVDFCGNDTVMEVGYSGYPLNAGCHLGGAAEADKFTDLGFGCNGQWNTPNFGMCVLNCAEDYVDADFDPRNGCETDLIVTATPEDHYVWVGNCVRNDNNGVNVTSKNSCGADLCVDCAALPGTVPTSGIACVLAEERTNKVPVLSGPEDYYSIQYACGILTGATSPLYTGIIDFNDIYCNDKCVDGDKDWTNGCEQGRGYTGGSFYFIGTVYDTLFDTVDYMTATTINPHNASNCTANYLATDGCDRRSSGFEYPVPGAWFYQAYAGSLNGDTEGLGVITYSSESEATVQSYLDHLDDLNTLLMANSLLNTTEIEMLNNRAFDCSLLYSTDLVYRDLTDSDTVLPTDPFGAYRYVTSGGLYTYGEIHHIDVSSYPFGLENNVCNRTTGLCNYVCQSGWDDYDLDPSNGCEADLSGPCGESLPRTAKRYTEKGSCGSECANCNLVPGAYNTPLAKSECLAILPTHYAQIDKFQEQLTNYRFVHVCTTEIIVPVATPPTNYYTVDAWKFIVCDPLSCFDADYVYENGCEVAVDYPFAWANYSKIAWDHWYSPLLNTGSGNRDLPETTYWVRDDGTVTIWANEEPPAGNGEYWFRLFGLSDATLDLSFTTWDVRTSAGPGWATYSWFNWTQEIGANSTASYSFVAGNITTDRGNNVFPYTGTTSAWDCSNSELPSGVTSQTLNGTGAFSTYTVDVDIEWTLTTSMPGPWFHVNQSVASSCNAGADPGATAAGYGQGDPPVVPGNFCTPVGTWTGSAYNKGCYDSWVSLGSGLCKLNCETDWADGDADPSNGCESYLKNNFPYPASRCGTFFVDPALDKNYPRPVYNYNQRASCGAGLCLNCQYLNGVNQAATKSDASQEPAGMLPLCVDGGDDWFSIEAAGAVDYPENTGGAAVTANGLPTAGDFDADVKYPGDYYCYGVINENACLRVKLPIRCTGTSLPSAQCGGDGNIYPALTGGRQTTLATAALIKVCADVDDAWETGCEVALGYNLQVTNRGFNATDSTNSTWTPVVTSTGTTIQLRGIYKRSVGVKPFYDGFFAPINWTGALPAAGFDCEILRQLPRAHTHVTPQISANGDDVIGCSATARTGPGTCSFKCETGWNDCDGNPWNGCETFNLLCGGTGGCEAARGYPAIGQSNFVCTTLTGFYAAGQYARRAFCDGNQIPYDEWVIYFDDDDTDPNDTNDNDAGVANSNDASQYDDRFEIQDHGIDYVTIQTNYVDPLVSRYTIKGYWDNIDIDYVCRVWLNGTSLRTNIPADGNAATGRCTAECRASGGYSDCLGNDSNGCDAHIENYSCRTTSGLCMNCADIPGTKTGSSSTCLSRNAVTQVPVNQYVINWIQGSAGVQGSANYVVSYGTAVDPNQPINIEFPQCDTRGQTALGTACNDDLCRDYDGDWENGCEFPNNYTIDERENWETPGALYEGPSTTVIDGFDCSWISDPQPDAGGRNYGGKTWAQKYHVNTNVTKPGYCVGQTGQADSGKCRIVCEAGWSDCDLDPTNGCENDDSLCAQCVIALGYPDSDVNCSTLNNEAYGFIPFATLPKCNGREGQDGQCSYYMCNIFDGFCDSGLGAVLNYATGQGSGCINLTSSADDTYCGADWNWRDIRGNASTVSYESEEDYEGGRMLDYSNFDGTGRCASCGDLNGYSSSAACAYDPVVAGHTYDYVTYYKPAASGWIDNTLGYIEFNTAGNTVGDYLCQLHGALDAGNDGACDRNLCVDEDYYWANGCETAVNYPVDLLSSGSAGTQRHADGNGDFGFDYHFAYNDAVFGLNWPYNPTINGAQVSGVSRSQVRGIWCPFLQFWSLSTDNYATGECDVFPCPHFHPNTVNSWITCLTNGTSETAGKCNFECNVEDGWKDCDANPLTGCETDIFNDGTCGSDCERVECNSLAGLNPFYWSECTADVNGNSACDLSICEPTLCQNLDSEWTTGCETAMNYPGGESFNCLALSDPAEMARLHLATIEPCNGEPGNHWAGKCEFTCEAGWVDCDGDFGNGCEHDGSLCQDCTNALGYVTHFDGADWWQFWGSASSDDTFYSVVYGSYFTQNTRLVSSFGLVNNATLDTNNILNDQFSGPNVAYSKYHHAFVASFNCSDLRTTYPGHFSTNVEITCDADVGSATAGRCVYACNASAGYFDCDGDPRNGCEHNSQHTACGPAGACRNCYFMSGVDYPVDVDQDGLNDGSMAPYTVGAFNRADDGNGNDYLDVYDEVNVTYFGLNSPGDLRVIPDGNVSPLRLGCTKDPDLSNAFTCNLNTCVTTVQGIQPCKNINQPLNYGWKDGCEMAQAYDFDINVAGNDVFDCSLMGPDVSNGDAPRDTNTPNTPSFHIRQVVGTVGCESKAVNVSSGPYEIYNGRGAWRYILARTGRSFSSPNETEGIYAFDYAGLEHFFRTNYDNVTVDEFTDLESTVKDFILYRVRGADKPGTCYYECEYGYEDCNGDPRDGCEIKVSACVDGDGLIGWDYLEGRSTNGCEVALGYGAPYSCLSVLGQPNINLTAPIYCRGGQDGNLDALGTCQYSCLPGFQDCNNDPNDGCEAEMGDDSCSCVPCRDYLPGTNALSDEATNPDSSISASTCQSDNTCSLPCDPAFCADEDGDWTNGCETALAYPTPRNATAIPRWDCSTWAKTPLLAKKHHIDVTKLNIISCYGKATDGDLRGTCSFQAACLLRENGGLFDYQDCNNDPRDGCEDTNVWCQVGLSDSSNPRGTLSDRCSRALNYAPSFDCENLNLGGFNVNTTSLLPYCDRDATNLDTRGDCVFNCDTGFANCDGLASNGCEADVTLDDTCDYDCVNCRILPGIDRLQPLGCVANPLVAGRYQCQFTCVGGTSATSCADRDGKWQNGCETALNGDQDEEGIFVNEFEPMDCSIMQEEAKKNPSLFRHHLHIDLTVAIPSSVDPLPAGSIFCNSLITTPDANVGKCYFACIPGFFNSDRKSFNGCEAAHPVTTPYDPVTFPFTAQPRTGATPAYPFMFGGYLIGDYEAEKYINFLLNGKWPTVTLPITFPLDLEYMPVRESKIYAFLGATYARLPIVWY